ncbi:hypothetical protein AB1Y20_001390 [Prymnesium parvum]|uniref:Uncharacterized protein n=1 Tax=Prymnesium parvum TaxID=97485 RepID=A0AB34KBK4_PRYPA
MRRNVKLHVGSGRLQSCIPLRRWHCRAGPGVASAAPCASSESHLAGRVDNASLAYYVVCDGDLRIDRSVSGIVHKFAGAAVAVQSVRQHSIAIDAHSSECFTASTAACQAVAYRGILTELRISQEVPTPVYSDSRSTLMVAQNSAALRKSIFILRRILYMREAVDAGEVDFYSCAGGTNPADPLTKYVTKRVFLGARRFWMGGALAGAEAAGAAISASAYLASAEHASGQQTSLTKSELPPPSRAEIPRPNKVLMTCSSGLLG